MTNAEIAAVFEQMADLLEFQGANPFRVRAYRNAAPARSTTCRESAAEIVDDPDRSLTDIEGIGKDLAEKIATLVETGSLPMLDELLAEIPESVLAMLRVPGLGPKRAATLYHELNITTLDELREACATHRVRELKGFGEKTEAAILAGHRHRRQADQRIYLGRGRRERRRPSCAHLRQCKAVEQIEVAGSYRRGKETVGDLDMLVVAARCRRGDGPLGRLSGRGAT